MKTLAAIFSRKPKLAPHHLILRAPRRTITDLTPHDRLGSGRANVPTPVERMRHSLSLAIGIRITKPDDALIDVEDLMPLLQTTEALLTRARNDKIDVNPITLRKGEHSLTLASLDGIVVFLACATEETPDKDETRYLVEQRRIELGQVFGQIMESNTPPSQRYASEPKCITALFLLITAFQAAQQLVLEGRSRSRYAGYNFDAMYLRVDTDDPVMTFEIIPTGMCRANQSDTLH